MRSLAEIKKKASPKIQTANKAAARYESDTEWAKRKLVLPGYSIYTFNCLFCGP